MHRQVIKMFESEVIEPSTSAWSSPVVMIRKSNDKYRFCIDFPKLNAVSKADAYPLPYIKVILRKLKSAKYISTFDLSSAYHEILLTLESKELPCLPKDEGRQKTACRSDGTASDRRAVASSCKRYNRPVCEK